MIFYLLKKNLEIQLNPSFMISIHLDSPTDQKNSRVLLASSMLLL